MELSNDVLLLLLPLIILQISLVLYCLRDWSRQPRDMPNRGLWLALILLVATIGPITYLVIAPRQAADTSWLDEGVRV